LIYFVIPTLPPSSNHAFVTVHGHRMLSKEGKAYKNETKTYIARTYPSELGYFSKDYEYAVLIRVNFPEQAALYCKGFKEGKAGSRYKKLDATNRIKLFEDAFAEATGIDDQQNFVFSTVKAWSEGKAFTEVWVWQRYAESNPIDDYLRAIGRA
jgi:hypothetical protein